MRTTPGAARARAVRRYAALLRVAYPSAFRVRFADHMAGTFEAELEAASTQGRLAILRCWTAAVLDIVRFGTMARMDALVDRGVTWPRAFQRPLALLLTTMVCGACLGMAMAMTHVVSLVARPSLGVVDPARLVAIYRLDPLSRREVPLTLGDLERLRTDAPTLEHVAGYIRMPVDVGTGDGALTVTAEVVSPQYFDTLGLDQVKPFGAPGVAWLSPRLAHLFAGRATTIVINDVSYAVAGTVPEDFAGVNFDWQQAPDLWLPVSSLRDLHPGFAALSGTELEAAPMLIVVGRQRDDVGTAQVAANVEQTLRLHGTQAPSPSVVSRVLPLHEATTYPGTRQQVVRGLAVLSVVAVLAFLLGVGTLVAYLSAVVVDRDRESALRASLGATPSRLTRDVVALTVPATLASMAAAVAVMVLTLDRAGDSLATLGVPALAATLGSLSSRLALTIALIVASATLMAYAGVLVRVHRIARAPTPLLRTGTVIAASRWRLGVVCLQAAIAAAVALPCAQYTAAWHAAVSASPGFDTTDLTLVDLETSTRRATATPGTRDYARVLDEVRRNPAIADAAMAAFGPWSKTRAFGHLDVRSTSTSLALPVQFNAVDRDYFESMGVVRQAGRTFAAASDSENATAVVINETLAAALGSPADAIGTSVDLAGSSGYEGRATIVGVVSDLSYHGPWEAPVSMVYVPLTRTTPPHLQLLVRTRAPVTDDLRASIARAVERALPGTTVRRTATWWSHVREVLARERLLTALLLGVAIVTAAASMVGLWSAFREHLHAQTRHTAIRVALGATFRFLVGPTMGRPLAAVAIGLATGVTGGLVINQHVVLDAPRPGMWLWTLAFLVLLVGLQSLSGATVVYRLRRVQPATLLRDTV